MLDTRVAWITVQYNLPAHQALTGSVGRNAQRHVFLRVIKDLVSRRWLDGNQTGVAHLYSINTDRFAILARPRGAHARPEWHGGALVCFGLSSYGKSAGWSTTGRGIPSSRALALSRCIHLDEPRLWAGQVPGWTVAALCSPAEAASRRDLLCR